MFDIRLKWLFGFFVNKTRLHLKFLRLVFWNLKMAHLFVILSSNNNLLAHQSHFHSQQQTTAYEAP